MEKVLCEYSNECEEYRKINREIRKRTANKEAYVQIEEVCDRDSRFYQLCYKEFRKRDLLEDNFL